MRCEFNESSRGDTLVKSPSFPACVALAIRDHKESISLDVANTIHFPDNSWKRWANSSRSAAVGWRLLHVSFHASSSPCKLVGLSSRSVWRCGFWMQIHATTDWDTVEGGYFVKKLWRVVCRSEENMIQGRVLSILSTLRASISDAFNFEATECLIKE